MAYYQIKLTPVEHFFFGGEKHNLDEVVNYFVESACFPQQTTLLGMTRYLMLLKHKLLGTGKIKTNATPIIGGESFDFNNPCLTFGKIRTLSPLYFLMNEKIHVPAPFDLDYSIGKANGNFYLHKNGDVFTTKQGHPSLLLTDLTGEKSFRLFSDDPAQAVVYSASQTGNEKAARGESKEDSFYKQTYMKMSTGWSFAIQVEIEDDLADETFFLPFGGERCLFKVEIRKQDSKVSLTPVLASYKRGFPGLYLISDSFAESSLMDITSFAVNNITSFRNFRSSVNTGNYSAFGVKSDGLKRSNRYNLLSRGSVLVFEDETSRNAAIKILKKDHCTRIGFNHYTLFN